MGGLIRLAESGVQISMREMMRRCEGENREIKWDQDGSMEGVEREHGP
jgi:hypothetical protein